MSEAAICQSSARAGAGKPAPELSTRISAVGLVTCDRPASAEASLRSYLDNSLRAGRNDCFIVCDDSLQPSSRSANQAMAARLRADTGLSLRYLGPDEKQLYAERLARASDLPLATVRCALLDELKLGFSRGANTNSLMLDTVGHPFFCFDDDSFCRPARRLFSDPPALSVSRFPVRLEVFPDPAVLLDQIEPEPICLLAQHEAWLGAGAPEMAAQARRWGGNADRPLNLDQADANLAASFGAGRGDVLVTWSGIYGDSGSAYSTYYLLLDGPDRDRLLASEQGYRQALVNRTVWKAPTSPQLVRNEMFQSVAFAADNRQALPPFMPFLRAGDTVFGQLLVDCFTDALIACLPWSVYHAPDAPRRQAVDEVWRRAGELRFAGLVELCLLSLPRSTVPVAPDARLQAIGQHLIQLANLAAPERETFLYPVYLQRLSGSIARLQSLLREHDEQPAFWADDVRRTIRSLERRLDAPEPLVPDEPGPPGRWSQDQVQRLLRGLGEVLTAWPRMRAAAQRLAGDGIRASRELGTGATANGGSP